MSGQKLTEKEQEKINEELLYAVMRYDLSAVKSAVEAGANVNFKNESGVYVLHMSITRDIQVTKYLLELGADPNAQDDDGWTALHNIACCGDYEKIRLLLNYGADMYIKNKYGETAYARSVINGWTDTAKLFISQGYVPTKEDIQLILNNKLFVATDYNDLDAIGEAVKAGADINAKDMYGNSAIYRSIRKSIEAVQYLLEARANPNIQNNDGDTALHKAVDCKHLNKIKILLKYKADMYIKNKRGGTPFDLALCNNDYDTAELFISHGYVPSKEDMQKIKNHRLFEAIRNNDLTAVKLAVEGGAEINSQDSYGDSPLHKIISKDSAIAKYLLEMGADPNIQNIDGWTVLYKAAVNGHLENVRLLLNYKTNMYIKDKSGETPFARSLFGGYRNIAELLVLNGYVPAIKYDYKGIQDYAERDDVRAHFTELAAQVQEHKHKLNEEAVAAEFAYADEVMEI